MTPEELGPASLALITDKIITDLFMDYQSRIADWNYNCDVSWKTGLNKPLLSSFGQITRLIDRSSCDNKVDLDFPKTSDSAVPKFFFKVPYSSHQRD